MHRLLFTIIILISTASLYAQTNVQTIYGNIKDKESGMPLIGASVAVINSEPLIGTTTDLNGHYTLKNIPVGRVSLQISYLAYETQTLAEILLSSGKAMNIDVQLEESLNSVEEITVLGKKEKQTSTMRVDNEMATVSAMSYSLEQSSRFAGSLNDPSRLVLSFAGVRNQGDIQNGISIRGNTPTALLWSIEGLEVQSPNHFARDGALGAVNMVSSNMLKSVDFYTAAFPAQYGNAGSGVFDLKTRKGNTKEYEFSLSAGIMGIETSVEGPFSKKYGGSFLLSYRYSTLAIFSKLGFNIANNTTPIYQDVNYKVHLPTKKIGVFELWGLYGNSEISEKNSEKYYEWSDSYDLALLGLKHRISVKEKTKITSQILFSQSKGYFYNKWFEYNEVDAGLKTNEARFPINESRLQIDLKSNTKVSAKHSLQLGINATYLDYYQNFKREIASIDINSVGSQTKSYRTKESEADASTFIIKGFMQHKIKLSKKLTFTPGLHFIHANYNKFFSVEPRLGIEYVYKDIHKFTMGAGMHSRLEPLGYYANEGNYQVHDDPFSISPSTAYGKPNQLLDATRSIHFVLGNLWTLAPKLQLKVETYVQYLYKIPVIDDEVNLSYYASINVQYPSIYDYNFIKQDVYVNKGKGLNYGIDISLEKAFAKNYYILLNGSYYESKYQLPSAYWHKESKWLDTKYNGNFILTATAGKDFTIGKKKNNTISLNTRIVWAGNNRVFDEKTQTPYGKRLKNYFRWDSRIAYIRNKKRYSWTLSLDMQNMTNRINEASSQVNKGAGALPIVNYKVQF